MSLLMDALKRAEKARQAQAEKQAEGEGASTSKLSLDPIDEEERQNDSRAEPAGEREPEAAPESPSEPPSSGKGGPATTHFSLTDDYTPTERVPPKAPPGDEDKLGPFSLARDDELSLEDTGEMLPVVREAERSLNEYFDEPETSAPTAGGPAETAGDDDSTVLGGRAAEQRDSAARRQAQSVFQAKSPAVARYRRNRALLMALPLLLIGTLAIGVLLFWDDLERTFLGAPPKLTQRTAAAPAPPAPPQSAPVANAQASAPAAGAASPGQPAAAAAPAPESAETAAPITGTVTPMAGGASQSGAATAPASKVAAASSAAAGTRAAQAGSSRSAPPTPRSASTRPPVATVGRPYAAAPFGGVRISRRSRPDEVHAGIEEAYLAYQRGDDATARELYSRVHRQHPNNRNALLGLGALAVRGGSYPEAFRHYSHLLSINPRDPIARAALINLNQQVPAAEGEGHIRRLLAEEPEQSFLHYTLGNLYARQGRWAEAQQSYFDAYRLDSGSADFAFNLAVSLDRLGKSGAALSYYHRALELASMGPASFDQRSTRMRVERLAAEGSG